MSTNQLPKPFDVNTFRQEFPFLQTHSEVVYLDNTATSLKPAILGQVTVDFYASAGSVHRSNYDADNTQRYEEARKLVHQWLNVESSAGVIWTSGTTHGVNLVAYGLEASFQAGDEIIISSAEHHANFVPWQQLALRKNLNLHILPFNLTTGLIDQKALQQALNPRTKLVALNWVSNITGATQPMAELIKIVRKHSQAKVLVDGSQAVGHFPIDIQTLDCDFLVFSAHKIYAPTGLGVLVGKVSALNELTPLFYGGKMVRQVKNSYSLFADLPYRLEAGTPNIAGVIAFGEILKWWHSWDMMQAELHAENLARKAKAKLSTYPNCKIFSAPNSKIISFKFDQIASADLAMLLGQANITLRVGKHCAEPCLQALGESSLVRISFAPYNCNEEVERFFESLDQALEIL